MRRALYVMLAHPELPSCADCARWLPQKGTGRRDHGQRRERPPHLPPPCAQSGPDGDGRPGPCPKIPHDAPALTREHAVQLTERQWQAYQHWQRCAAVGQFPDDELVRYHAAIFREVEREAAEYRAERRTARLEGLIQLALLTREK